ncbi:chitinase [Paenibacillus glucanolyticus]|uniref:Chitinase n=1 Tax=Paenibacillus glucanolyticus TaxID=59843 RepID=A0A163KEN2_9BACL|nr:chitinase [Paenibacillus glucanolyticus]KZS47174.1 chitinase [Paenibacillus glucanolyticus]
MTLWKYPLSGKTIQRSMIAALSATLLMTPLHAFAADETPQAAASPATLNVSLESSTSGTSAPAQVSQSQSSSLAVGEHRLISRKEIVQNWDDLDPDYTPEKAIEAVKALLSKEDFEALFPYRLGSEEWYKVAKGKEYYKADQKDYFSYDNLIHAVAEVSNLKIKIRTRQGTPSAQEIYRLDKDGRVETLVVRSADFNSASNRNKTIETVIIDGGTFLKEGFKKDRKRELAAFLANLSHETGGGWATAPGGPLRWGLFWNENIAGRTGVNQDAFVDPASAELYPGTPDKRYYGRGPIMLSWNFNYGLFSSIIYGDKSVLLDNPEIVAADGKIGYMTAILFWMTPQNPKPSAHDVMVGRWKPSPLEKFRGLGDPGFGTTVMVLNGLEANLGETEGSPVQRRAGHYRDITNRMGVDITGEKVDTLGMKPF